MTASNIEQNVPNLAANQTGIKDVACLAQAELPLFQRFEAFYRVFSDAPFQDVGEIYSSNVQFEDPIHTLEGLDALTGYLSGSLKNVRFCRFEFLRRLVGEGQASYVWRMCFAHEKINGGEALVVPGSSFLLFDDKITFHQDFYDMGAMLYEHIPVLKLGVKAIKRRIGS